MTVTYRPVTVWHTNAVTTDVPDTLTDAEAREYILRLIDDGQLAFISVEGATEWSIGEWPESVQRNPMLGAS